MSTDSSHPELNRGRAKRVGRYLLVLFAAAFLLLLVSFFMQQRNHQVLLRLNNSINAQEDLKTTNGQLQLQVTDLQEQLDAQEKALADKERELQALEWLRLLEDALRSSQGNAGELLKQFQETGLEDALPETSPVEGGTSPRESYETLCHILGE